MSKSIGKLLREQRESKRLALEDVHKFIKIHPKYLAALENDDYSVFEGKVHAKGFLKVYVEFLSLNLAEILALWRREYEGIFDKALTIDTYNRDQIDKHRLLITPQLVFTGLIVTMVLLFFTYLFYQYKNYTGAPVLNIFYPENNIVVTSDILDITGKTQLDSDVYINNQKLVLNNDGSFATSLKLKEGINTLNINAINKLNKKSEVVRTIIYRPENKPQAIIEEKPRETTPSQQTQPLQPSPPDQP